LGSKPYFWIKQSPEPSICPVAVAAVAAAMPERQARAAAPAEGGEEAL